MTDEQINLKIAEVCGWFYYDGWNHPDGRNTLPNYVNDLNAMHEAEEHIPDSIAYVYGNKIGTVTGAEDSLCMSFYCATARQRAEAFLRTLGKWK
jgi:hypothetical protein